jgi:lysophospholipase L1-like esterase
LAAAALLCSAAALAAEPAKADLPKVVLLGDSIRLSYAPLVAKQLEGKTQIVSPPANGGDSGNVLKHLEEWAIREQPAIVHFNAGIHDTKKAKASGMFQVSPAEYEANLRQIVSRIRKETEATVLFATTTPIHDQRAAAARQERDYELLNASVEQYNAIAVKVMGELKVPIEDLHTVLAKPKGGKTLDELIVADGVHLTPEGREMVGQAVAGFLQQHLPAAK